MYRLLIEDDEGKNTVVPLPNSRDEITIGRKEGNTIRLTERNVSRQHARLVRTNNGFFIEDKGSYTGVKVNGDRISGRRHVKEGDEILIGDYHLSLQLDKEASKDAPKDAPKKANGAAPAPAAAKEANGAPRSGTAIIKLSPEREKQLRASEGKAEASTERARLCLISGPQAGKIFAIERDEVMLGRTEENDIVLNHRSISRNHAKIIITNNTYQIVDLGSANGVRVNGEEYGKIDLRRGDKIDLGHVRLRFIGPGETFVFDPSMREDVAGDSGDGGGGGGRGLVVALVVLLLAGGGLAAAYFGGYLGGAGPEVTPDPATANTPKTEPASVPAPPPSDKAKELLAKAEAAASERKWKEALDLAKEAGDADKASLYEEELNAAENLKNCLAARDAGNLESAMANCGVINPNTQTAKEAASDISEVQEKFREKYIKLIKASLARKDQAGLKKAKEDLAQMEGGLSSTDSDVANFRRDIVALDKELNPEKFAGQADDDGDGVSNANDDCPDQKGVRSNKGCPEDPNKDTDGDGIPDKDDKCPKQSGTDARGCPESATPAETDSDGDGVADKADKCPTEKGTPAKSGCPEEAPAGGKTAKELIEEALSYSAGEDKKRALDLLTEAAKLDPSNPEIYRIRAVTYQNIGNPELACKAISRYLKLAGSNSSQAAKFIVYRDSQDIQLNPNCRP